MKINEENLKHLGKLLDPTGIIQETKQEVLQGFKKVLEIINDKTQKLTDKVNQIAAETKSSISSFRSELKESQAKNERVLNAELESLLRRFSAEVKKIDARLAEIKDGKDADIEKITESVIKGTLDELSKKEKDIFEINDIKGLEEELEKIKAVKVGGGGGVIINSPRIEIPQGTQNAVNTDFTVAHKPAFITVNGQMLYADNGYSIAYVAGVCTLTLDNPPEATDILRSHY